MTKRGAIELSLGFIVAVVFAVVLLSLAILWLQGIIGNIGGLTDDLTQQAQSKLQETFQSTQNNFAIWPSKYDLVPGKQLKMSAGIKNDADDGNDHFFVLNVVPATASNNICPGGDLDSCPEIRSSMEDWVSGFKTPPYKIEINRVYYPAISVNVPASAKKGTYIFSVVACKEPIASYSECNPQTLNWGGSAQQLTITVK